MLITLETSLGNEQDIIQSNLQVTKVPELHERESNTRSLLQQHKYIDI